MTRRIAFLRPLAVAWSAALFLGCGSSTSGGGTTSASPPADWSTATPTTLPSSALTSIDVSGAGSTSSGLTVGGSAATLSASALADPCYPHLFERTSEMTEILNNHTHKMMDRIAAIAAHPRALNGSAACTVDSKSSPSQVSCTIDAGAGLFNGYPLTLTWQKSATSAATRYVTNVYIQPSSTPAASLHQCDLGATASPPPTFGACSGGTCPTCTTIFSATLDVTANANGFDVASPAGTPMTFDFTSLSAVDPNEKATGQLQVNVDFTKDTTKPNPFRRVLGFTFSGFLPALTAAEIAAGEANHGARSGSLAHVGYTGSGGGGGGAMEFVDEVILFCPPYSGEATSPTLYSDALTVGRWYLDSTTTPGTTTLYGRVDAEAVGDGGGTPPGTAPTGNGGGNAQLPGGTTYVGAVCYGGAMASSGAVPADSGADPWMFVEETGGTSVVPSSYRCGPEATAGDTSTCASSCGSKFGPLPRVSGGTLTGAYAFNGLTPSISASGIPTDPSAIETALAPLLCGTGVGTAWTGQANCP
jgi:hypothetical protein